MKKKFLAMMAVSMMGLLMLSACQTNKKTADSAPRLKASIPIPPLPLNRSRKRQSGISGCRILNSVSFIRSVVGRVSMPGTVLRLSRLAVPAITLILN
mgnify:CR=1 FL=1